MAGVHSRGKSGHLLSPVASMIDGVRKMTDKFCLRHVSPFRHVEAHTVCYCTVSFYFTTQDCRRRTHVIKSRCTTRVTYLCRPAKQGRFQHTPEQFCGRRPKSLPQSQCVDLASLSLTSYVISSYADVYY